MWEKKTLQYREWLKTQKNKKGEPLSDYFVRQSTVAIRSFFSFHRMELKFIPGERKRLGEAKPKRSDYRFSREDLKRMTDVADLEGKYVVVVGKSFGLRAGDFLALTRGHFDPYIDREPPISIGKIYTTKEKVPAFPFVDTDAKPIIKAMLDNLTRQGRTDPSESMLPYRDPNTLTQILKRLADKAGIKYGDKVVRFHCLRKFLIDRLKNVMPSESAWKQVVGKKIPESAYVSEEGLRDGYIKAMEETTFVKLVGAEEVELLAEKKALMAIAELMRVPEERRKKIFRSIKAAKTPEELAKVKDVMKEEQQTQTNGGCQNGVHCQRIVSEEELGAMLEAGWKFVATLPSGKIVVSNGGV
jgi:hypothetical protein